MSAFFVAHPWAAHGLLALIKILLFPVGLVLSFCLPMLVYFERRIAALIQDRLGPNRVGPFGLFQSVADALKLFFKEDVIPGHVDAGLYVLAPTFVLIPVMLTYAPIPFGPGVAIPGGILTADPNQIVRVPMVIAEMDMGLLYLFAVSSLSVYGISLGGWASNSKYSIFGGIRSAAQMISYEICLGLSVLGVFILDQTFNISRIVEAQAQGVWHIVDQPLGFIIFLVSYFAETNRLPFDLPEAEQEIVAGYHIEYSSMKFSMFFMAEYTAMFLAASVTTCIFLGGWDIPFLDLMAMSQAGMEANSALQVTAVGLLGFLAFFVKVSALLFLFIAIRWTLPRFRYDQLMDLGWKVFLPLGLVNLVITAFVKVLFFSGS